MTTTDRATEAATLADAVLEAEAERPAVVASYLGTDERAIARRGAAPVQPA